jgi:hypothetical protein
LIVMTVVRLKERVLLRCGAFMDLGWDESLESVGESALRTLVFLSERTASLTPPTRLNLI